MVETAMEDATGLHVLRSTAGRTTGMSVRQFLLDPSLCGWVVQGVVDHHLSLAQHPKKGNPDYTLIRAFAAGMHRNMTLAPGYDDALALHAVYSTATDLVDDDVTGVGSTKVEDLLKRGGTPALRQAAATAELSEVMGGKLRTALGDTGKGRIFEHDMGMWTACHESQLMFTAPEDDACRTRADAKKLD